MCTACASDYYSLIDFATFMRVSGMHDKVVSRIKNIEFLSHKNSALCILRREYIWDLYFKNNVRLTHAPVFESFLQIYFNGMRMNKLVDLLELLIKESNYHDLSDVANCLCYKLSLWYAFKATVYALKRKGYL